eukprot:scaffold1280_cov246-Pinguiococcus_pyrenoidosus.AAC.17
MSSAARSLDCASQKERESFICIPRRHLIFSPSFARTSWPAASPCPALCDHEPVSPAEVPLGYPATPSPAGRSAASPQPGASPAFGAVLAPHPAPLALLGSPAWPRQACRAAPKPRRDRGRSLRWGWRPPRVTAPPGPACRRASAPRQADLPGASGSSSMARSASGTKGLHRLMCRRGTRPSQG